MSNIRINEISLTGSLTSGDSFIVLDTETQATKRASIDTITNYVNENSYFFAVPSSSSRDSIDVSQRKQGMHVLTLDDQRTYRLIGSDLSDNSNWVEIAGFEPAYITRTITGSLFNGVPYAYDILDIYVEKEENGGSDVTGDGTQAAPYSSIEKAFEKIPHTIPDARKGYYVYIHVGPGKFILGETQAFYNPVRDPNMFVYLIGSVNEVETINVTDTSNTAVPGKYSSKLITCDPFTTTVEKDGEYFLNFGGSELSPASYLCRSSSSPQLEVLGFPSVGEAKLITLATTIEPKYPLRQSRDRKVTMVHIKTYQTGSYISSFSSNRSCIFNGWFLQTYDDSITNNYCHFGPSLPGTGSNVTQLDIQGGSGYNIFNYCVFDDVDLLWRGGPEWTSIQNSVLKNNTKVWISEYGDPSYLYTWTLDLENCALGFDIQNQNSVVIQRGNISVENCGTVIKLNYNAMYRNRGSSVISGSTTGIPIEILDGGTIINLKNACNGKLVNTTNPGQEIRVGTGKTPITFSSLPATDLDTFSRAN
jgi:hypothetical protein